MTIPEMSPLMCVKARHGDTASGAAPASTPEATEYIFHAPNPAFVSQTCVIGTSELGGIYRFEDALDVLLRCSLRRKEIAAKGTKPTSV